MTKSLYKRFLECFGTLKKYKYNGNIFDIFCCLFWKQLLILRSCVWKKNEIWNNDISLNTTFYWMISLGDGVAKLCVFYLNLHSFYFCSNCFLQTCICLVCHMKFFSLPFLCIFLVCHKKFFSSPFFEDAQLVCPQHHCHWPEYQTFSSCQ